MYLYFNGDSFVAGDELGDDILPDFPGLLELNKHDRSHTEWFKNSYNIRFKDEYRNKRIQLEHERSFPYKVSNILNLPFVNNAQHGSSMDCIARTTITDLIKLKKTVKGKIIAFIGTTIESRSEIAINNKRYVNKKWLNMQANNIILYEPDESAYIRKYKVINETDYHHLINFYKNVIMIKDFCHINNITLFWIAGIRNVNKENYSMQDEDYLQLKEYANLDYSLDIMECVKNNFKGQKVMMPGGHPGEIVHDLVAKRISRMIKNI